MRPIRVELELVNGQFTTSMLHAGQTLQRFNEQAAGSNKALQGLAQAGGSVVQSVRLADQNTRGFLSTLRDVAIVTGIVSVGINKLANVQSTWVGHIVRVNTEFERLNYQMRSMSTSSDPIREAGQNVLFLRKAALDMPFRLGTINDAFVKLKATGTDPLNGSLQAIADGVAAFGGTDESLKRVVLGISQMSGKGVIQMEELRQQLGEQMPTAVRIMAQSMGISMAQLIRDIGTGTLEAKTALSLFYAELDRAYGGRARYMMQSFEGQLKKMQTQLQNLALVAGGLGDDGQYTAGGFMATLRDQIRDINDFLSSGRANAFAASLGQGLTATVRVLREAVGFLYEFRSEIGRIATAAAGAFAFSALLGGLRNLTNMVRVLSGDLRMLSLNFQRSGDLARLSAIQWNSGAGALRAGATGARAMISGLGSLLMIGGRLIPVIGAIGLSVYAAGEYFGWFRNKVNEAYEELKQFGAESRAMAQEGIDAKRRQIEEEIRLERERIMAQRQGGMRLNASGELEPDDSIGRLWELNQELAKFDREAAKIMREAGAREDDKLLRDYMDALDDKRRVRQNAYTNEQNAIQAHYDKLLAEAQAAGKSTQAIEEERGMELLKSKRRLHEAEIEELTDHIKRQQQILFSSTDSAAMKRARIIEESLKTQLATAYDMRNAVANQIPGSKLVKGAVDDSKLLEKGRQHLERLQAEVKGLAASLQGASAEVVELYEILANGEKYGNVDTRGVQELIDKLIEAQTQKEMLDKLMKGANRLENDVEQARIKAIEEAMELKERALGRELTESERIRLRIESGYYEGFGPQSQTMKWLQGVLKQYDAQGRSLNNIGNVLRNNTFGDQSVSKIRTVNDELRTMASTLGLIATGIGGINFGGMGVPGMMAGMTGTPNLASVSGGMKVKMADLMSMFLREGASLGVDQKVAAGIIGNFVKESNLNTAAVGDNGTSFGLAQWHKERWQGLNTFSRMQGLATTDPLAQVRYTLHELQQPGYAKTFAKMKMAASPEAVADIFMREFERPAAWAMQQSGPGRMQAARNAYALGATGASTAVGQTPLPQPGQVPVYEPEPSYIGFLEHMNTLQEKHLNTLTETGIQEKENQESAKKVTAIEQRKKLVDQLEAEKEAMQDLDGENKNYLATRRLLEKNNVDLGSKEAKEALAAAKELDTFQYQTAERQKALSKIKNAEEDFSQRRIELARQAEEAHARMLDPLEKKSSSAFRALERELDDYVRQVDLYYQGDKQKVAEAAAFKQQMLTQQRNMEAQNFFAEQAKKTQAMQTSLMSESQQRQFAMQQELAEIDRMVAAFQGSEQQKVMIVEQAEQAKAAIRAKYADQMNPLAAQMREWGDLQGQLAQASTRWMDSLAGGLTDLIMGTGDLRSVLQGIVRDMLNMGIKYMMSQIMQGKTGQSGKGGKKGMISPAAPAGKGKGAGAGKGKMFGAMHTGGIVGRGFRMTRMVNPAVFAGAPRFHTGGIIGSDEVPIIAKKGEGVFTPEQMSALGGLQGAPTIQISAPVTVNANGGKPEENEDLARRTAKAMENTMRAVAADEIRKAARPGNFANTRSR